MRILLCPLLLLLLLLGAPVSAQVTMYNDQASFLAALAPGFYLETFDGLAEGTVMPPLPFSANGFDYDVDLQAPSFSTNLFPFAIPGGSPGDIVMAGNDARDTILFDFTSGNVTAVGGFFFTSDLGGNPIAADVIVDTDQTAPMAHSTGGSTTAFLGFTSDTPFDFLSILGDSTVVVAFASANDVIVGGTVPEPATPLLLLTALAGFVHRSRSRGGSQLLGRYSQRAIPSSASRN